MKIIKTRIVLLFALSFVFVFALLFHSSKAHAASLTVSGGCSLNNAIMSVNNAADTGGCTSTGSYGTNDTINLPSGTTTLSSPLPNITSSIKIVGQGITNTTIDGNGFGGFSTDFASTPLTKDFSIEQVKMTNFLYSAVSVYRGRYINISSIDVDDCTDGVHVAESLHIFVSNSIIRNNTSTELVNDTFNGLFLTLAGLVSSDKPSVSVDNTKIINNQSMGERGYSGLQINVKDDAITNPNQFITSSSIVIHNTTIKDNQAGQVAGLFVTPYYGPLSPLITELLVDSTTIANNIVTVPVPVVVNAPGYTPVIAGVYLSGKLTAQQNFTNVTIVNNSINNPAPDNRNSASGFFGTFGSGSADLKITNVTIVNNTNNQPATAMEFSAFALFYTDIDFSNYPNIILNEVRNGAQVQNSVIARNLSNGNLKNCLGSVSLISLGINATIDGTPTNMGGNITDDPNCTGYNIQSNLFATLGPLQDNGGPVDTVALLPGSPAIGIAGQVLGISTDARGIARPANPDAGAFQTVLGVSTNNPNNSSNGGLASTGENIKKFGIIAILLLAGGAVLLIVLIKQFRRKR